MSFSKTFFNNTVTANFGVTNFDTRSMVLNHLRYTFSTKRTRVRFAYSFILKFIILLLLIYINL